MRKPEIKWLGDVSTYVMTFSKIITIVWAVSYIEALLFVQIATVLQFGDVAALQYVLDAVTKLGSWVVPFYFGTKVVENVAKGYETYKLGSATVEAEEVNEDDEQAG